MHFYNLLRQLEFRLKNVDLHWILYVQYVRFWVKIISVQYYEEPIGMCLPFVVSDLIALICCSKQYQFSPRMLKQKTKETKPELTLTSPMIWK